MAFAPTDITVLSFWLEELRSRGAAWEVEVSANVISLLAEPLVNPAANTQSANIQSKPHLRLAPAGIVHVKYDRNYSQTITVTSKWNFTLTKGTQSQ